MPSAWYRLHIVSIVQPNVYLLKTLFHRHWYTNPARFQQHTLCQLLPHSLHLLHLSIHTMLRTSTLLHCPLHGLHLPIPCAQLMHITCSISCTSNLCSSTHVHSALLPITHLHLCSFYYQLHLSSSLNHTHIHFVVPHLYHSQQHVYSIQASSQHYLAHHLVLTYRCIPNLNPCCQHFFPLPVHLSILCEIHCIDSLIFCAYISLLCHIYFPVGIGLHLSKWWFNLVT
jgi:hypothetical protein